MAVSTVSKVENIGVIMEQTEVYLVYHHEDETGRYYNVVETFNDTTNIVKRVFVPHPLTPEQVIINKQAAEIKELNRELEMEKSFSKQRYNPYGKKQYGIEYLDEIVRRRPYRIVC